VALTFNLMYNSSPTVILLNLYQSGDGIFIQTGYMRQRSEHNLCILTKKADSPTKSESAYSSPTRRTLSVAAESPTRSDSEPDGASPARAE
jgi:hypothetical protein